MLYLDYVILEQLIAARNSLENIAECDCAPNEVKLLVPLYNLTNGEFLGLDEYLA